MLAMEIFWSVAMSRMGREFTLVLLGTGILSAGYFAAASDEEEHQKESDKQAAHRVGGSGHYHGGYHVPLIFAHSMGYSGSSTGRPYAANAGITRGGIGGIGHAATAGG
jgi:hypothetical protein